MVDILGVIYGIAILSQKKKLTPLKSFILGGSLNIFCPLIGCWYRYLFQTRDKCYSLSFFTWSNQNISLPCYKISLSNKRKMIFRILLIFHLNKQDMSFLILRSNTKRGCWKLIVWSLWNIKNTNLFQAKLNDFIISQFN